MSTDAALNLAVASAALGTGAPFLLYHIAAMATAQCLTAFFAVWITHHDLGPQDVARTQRARVVNWATYNMFLHLEHHLFPAVPVKRLGIISQRLAALSDGRDVKLVLPEPRIARRRDTAG
jgi:fatty acid desaturase